ncbi:MAG: UDP-N-acetylglucosamine acyltransferase [Candidatus Sumerlaeota bacterium]|nr:UDP-N-acetylglucosamine acyltransferase [Candidatus Sumerlaeota bacterium]
MAIHPSAVIDPTAQIADDVEIGPNVVVGPNVKIGSQCVLMAGAVVCANTTMGAGNRVHFNAVLGGDPQYLGFDPKTASGLVIGDNNEFRELCTVHRGLKDGTNTVIGNNCFLMATAHVAHDCTLGNNIVLANGSMLAGHVSVGDRAFVSGLCAVHQFCRIGRLAMVGGMSGVSKDVPPFLTTRGDFAFLVGVNVVGLRRAGVGPESRMAIKNAFKNLFRSGHPLNRAITDLREAWQESQSPIPGELSELLDFCATPSKRGILAARSLSSGDHQATEDIDVE